MKNALSFIFGILVCSSAVADPTADDRRELCRLLEEKGTHVWVTKNTACIPVNACSANDSDIKDAYCDYTFSEYYFADVENAKQVASDIYKRHRKKTLTNFITTDWEEKNILGAETSEGGYVTLQFGSKKYGNNTKSLIETSCIVNGGWPSGGKFVGKEYTCKCETIKTTEKCSSTAIYAALLIKNPVIGQLNEEETCELNYRPEEKYEIKLDD